MLASSFHMVFPGDCHFDRIEGLDYVRQKSARHGPQNLSIGLMRGTPPTVPSFTPWGTLYGKKVDEQTEYRDIRFVDRFVIQDGKFVSQMVWNDMGEHGFGPGDRPVYLQCTGAGR